jgi:transposase
MIALPTGTRIWLAAGVTDMRRGMDGPASLAQVALEQDRSRATCSLSAAAVAIW